MSVVIPPPWPAIPPPTPGTSPKPPRDPFGRPVPPVPPVELDRIARELGIDVREAAKVRQAELGVAMHATETAGETLIRAAFAGLRRVRVVGRLFSRRVEDNVVTRVRRTAVPAGVAPTGLNARTLSAMAEAMENYTEQAQRFARQTAAAIRELGFEQGSGYRKPALGTIRSRLTELRADLGFPSTGEGNAHNRLDIQRGRLNAVETTSGHLVTNLGTQTERINTIATEWIPALSGRVTAHDSRLDAVEGSTSTLTRQVTVLQTETVPQLELGLAAVEGATDAHGWMLAPLLASGLAPAAVASAIAAAVDNTEKLRLFCRFDVDDWSQALGALALLPSLALIVATVDGTEAALGELMDFLADPFGV